LFQNETVTEAEFICQITGPGAKISVTISEQRGGFEKKNKH
jgi:hypothetical protein